ncbi:MAG: hypothetical protein ACXVIS_03965 [Halobacteriota archaeon]
MHDADGMKIGDDAVLPHRDGLREVACPAYDLMSNKTMRRNTAVDAAQRFSRYL